MSFLYFEGTKDYVAATPALIVTYSASGSITAGRCLNLNTTGDVYVPTAHRSGASKPAGVALATVANGEPCPVMVWGYAKNLQNAGLALNVGDVLAVSGSGLWTTSGSLNTPSSYSAGKVVSGSAASGLIVAFIDCMKNFGVN